MSAATRADPLRLLVVTHSLTGGGAERFAANLVTHLDRRHFAPDLCLVTDCSTYPTPADVAVTTLGYRSIVSLPRSLWALRRRLAVDPPDLVLSNVLSTNCLTGGALRALPGPRRPPWVARVGLAPELSDPWPQRAWARAVYPLASTLVTNSRAMATSFEGCYPNLRGRPQSVPNPTDFTALEQRAEEKPERQADPGEATLLAVGRLTPQKRPDLLVAALAEIRRRRPARLWLCGEGPLEGAVVRQAAELGVGSAVECLGFCDNPFALMRQADLLLLASDYEGLPNALIEAQGLGLPAVATRCPYGPDEIVEDGVTGRLVPRGDAQALGLAAEELLAAPSVLEEMGRAATERARRAFDVTTVMPRWETLLTTATRRA